MHRNAVLGFALLFLGLWMTSSALHAADPALAKRWTTYGQQLYAARQYDKAIQAFTAAAKANSADAAAWKGLGNCYYAKRDYANALKYYKYALQMNPNDASLAQFVQKLQATVAKQGGAAGDPSALAARYYQARQYQYAIYYYKQALAKNPNDAKAYQGLGNCYYAMKDKPNAVAAYRRSLQINPANVGLAGFLAKYDPAGAVSAGVKVASGPTNWVDPLWRSMILPGWGQFHNGESTKGLLLGGVTLGLLGGSVVTYMSGAAARDKYMSLKVGDPQKDFDDSYSAWESNANMNHIFALGFLGAYTFTLVDAVMSAKPSTSAVGFHEEAPPVQLGLLPETGGLGMKLRLAQF